MKEVTETPKHYHSLTPNPSAEAGRSKEVVWLDAERLIRPRSKQRTPRMKFVIHSALLGWMELALLGLLNKAHYFERFRIWRPLAHLLKLVARS